MYNHFVEAIFHFNEYVVSLQLGQVNFESVRLDELCQLRLGLVRVGQGWLGQGWLGQGWLGQGWLGQGWLGQGWLGQGWSGQGCVRFSLLNMW